MARKKKQQLEPEVLGFFGVGLDNPDGHQRLTRTEHFLLVGGSGDTHERMQDTAIRFNEGLVRSGKVLHEATLEEVLDLFREALDQ